jgi:hypothetical protein
VIERTKDCDAPSSPRSSRISSTTARYSRLELARRSSGRMLVRPLLDLDEQPALRVRLGRAGNPRCSPSIATAAAPPAADAVGHACDGADRGVLALVLGHEQHASSSPTSTVSVTFMLGKTTMSSSGTSKQLGHGSVHAPREHVV